ncbi:MAG: hypothetical protein JSR99_09905 [Proteobacteria bacterium]|nr:hypothetical protein [Pseudomonadota bacterium]
MDQNPSVNTGVFLLGPLNPISGLRPILELGPAPARPVDRVPSRQEQRGPRHMERRILKSGEPAYYWKVPTRDRDNGCAIPAEPLGTDFESASRRADELNELLDRWRVERKVHLALRPTTMIVACVPNENVDPV